MPSKEPEKETSNTGLPGSAKAFEDILGPATRVDDETLHLCTTNGAFSSIAFDLYKETASLVILVSQLFADSAGPQKGLPRDQAICAGLLVRIAKFMTAVMQLVSGDPNRREVVMSLTRSILESSTNIRYLLLKSDPEVFSSFVRSGLGPERELHDVIHSNIAERGGSEWAIERRMLKSIERTCRLANVSIADIPAKSSWINLRERMKAIGDESLYLHLQRIGSHAVHGTWTDLILHHLDEGSSGLIPSPDWASVDARILCPPCHLVLEAVSAYMTHYFEGLPDLEFLTARIDGLLERLHTVDEAHEAWMGRG